MGSTVEGIEEKVEKTTLITDFKQLTKVGLSVSVVFSSVAGYLLAAEQYQCYNFIISYRRLSNGWSVKCL